MHVKIGELTLENDFGGRAHHGAIATGTEPHYRFKLAALDVKTLPHAPRVIADIWNAAQKHMVAQAELVGTYAR